MESRPNPVTLLKKIKGCVIENNAVIGETDIDGNTYASCFVGGEGGYETGHDYRFTARTNEVRPQSVGGQTNIDDTTAVIYGDTWYVVMDGTFGNPLSPADVQKYAAQLGGTIAKSASDLEQPNSGDDY